MKFTPHFCVVFNAVVWGLIWIPMKWLSSNGLSIIWTTFFAYLILSGILFVLKPRSILQILHSKTLIFMALAYGLTNICFNWAVTNGDVVRVVFLFYLMPIWAAIFAKLFLSENLGYQGLCRIFLAVLGLIFVLDIFDQISLSLKVDFYEILAILGGIFFALANVFLRKAKSHSSFDRSMSIFFGSFFVPLVVLVISFLFNNFGILTIPVGDLKKLFLLDYSSIFFVLVFMAIALGTANFCLQFGGSKLLVQTTTLLMVVEIPVATISLAILTNQVTEVSVLIGGGLIVIAAIWAGFDQPGKK